MRVRVRVRVFVAVTVAVPPKSSPPFSFAPQNDPAPIALGKRFFAAHHESLGETWNGASCVGAATAPTVGCINKIQFDSENGAQRKWRRINGCYVTDWTRS